MNAWRQITQQMRRSARPSGVFLPWLVLMGTASCTGLGPPSILGPLGVEVGKSAATESYADFQTFEFTRTSGWNCLDPGIVAEATITRGAGGSYQLELGISSDAADGESEWTWDDALGGAADWEVDGTNWTCGYGLDVSAVRYLPVRALTAAEVQRMRSVFSAVTVEYEYVEADIDYYEIDRVRWDDRSLTANPTYGPSETIRYEDFEQIAQLLEDFRAASPE
jgi:hypothetical protein